MTYVILLTVALDPDEFGSKRNVQFESSEYGDLDVAQGLASEIKAKHPHANVEVFNCRKVSLRHVSTH